MYSFKFQLIYFWVLLRFWDINNIIFLLELKYFSKDFMAASNISFTIVEKIRERFVLKFFTEEYHEPSMNGENHMLGGFPRHPTGPTTFTVCKPLFFFEQHKI
jgi:hypothetical protein